MSMNYIVVFLLLLGCSERVVMTKAGVTESQRQEDELDCDKKAGQKWSRELHNRAMSESTVIQASIRNCMRDKGYEVHTEK